MSDACQTVFHLNPLPQPDHVIDRLPPVFRIQSIERLPFDARNLLNLPDPSPGAPLLAFA